MNAAQHDTPIRYAVCEYATHKHFLNVYDALGVDRLQWEAVHYDRERRRHIARAFCYLTTTRCKLLVHQVLSGEAQGQPGWTFEVFGGGMRDGQVESRLFTVVFDPGDDDRFAKMPWRITIAMGPGKKTSTGGIAPAGQPTTRVAIRLSDADWTAICLEIRDFLTAHQREIEDVRKLEQLQRYQQRLQMREAADRVATPDQPAVARHGKQPIANGKLVAPGARYEWHEQAG